MKAQVRFILLIGLVGVTIGGIIGLIQYFVLRGSLLAFLVGDAQIAEILARFLLVACMIALGVILARSVVREQRSAAALREAEERYLNLVERTSDGVLLVQNRAVVYANPRFAQMAGETVDSVIGTPLANYLDPDLVNSLLDRSRRGEPSEQQPSPGQETVMGRKVGRELAVAVSAGAVAYLGDPATLLVVQDVSERARLHDQLERIGEVQAAGKLALGIVFSLRNMMTVILGFSELLLADAAPGSEQEKDLLRIQEAARAACDQLRSFGGLRDRGRRELSSLDLNEVIRDMTSTLHLCLGEGAALEADLSPELGLVQADQRHVRDALVNLVSNARDALPQGGTVTISTANVDLDEAFAAAHPRSQAGPHVMLSVADTGKGMAPEVKARLFEPFFTTKVESHAAGLGLAMVHGLMVRSGGCIEVDSEQGLGTTVKLYFPRVPQQEDAEEADQTQNPHGTETVLVVDRDVAMRELAARMLSSLGYTIWEATDADDAADICRISAQPIDLVLVDFSSPDASGLQVAKKLRELQPDLPVLYLSPRAGEIMRQRRIPGVTDQLLPKPFTMRQLARQVRETLDRSRGAGAGGASI